MRWRIYIGIVIKTSACSNFTQNISLLLFLLLFSGKPNPAIFRSHSAGRSKDTYNITWTVNSYTPIEEFKLFFRKLPTSNPPPPPGQPQYQHAKRPQRRVSLSFLYWLLKIKTLIQSVIKVWAVTLKHIGLEILTELKIWLKNVLLESQ